MRGLLLDSNAEVRVADRPKPERQPGEALLKMRLAGVCDTDLQLAKGYMGYEGTLGHEFVAEVLEAESHALGQRVVGDINAGCGRCEDCLQRDGHHCATRTVLGIVGRDGAFAEQLVLPERCLVPVPDSVSDDMAVFAEPLAAALHVLDELDASSPGRIAVLGDGKLGLLISLALVGTGADVLLVGHHEDKLAIAKHAGARTCLENDLGDAGGFAMVVEATGSAQGLTRALSLAAPKATIILKTTVAGPIEIDLAPVVIHELRLVGSRCGSLQRAIDHLATGRVDPTPMIQARYPLDRADEAMRHAGRKGTLKILVEPDPQRLSS